MDIFNVLTLIGGLSLFLFGMNLMGEALERRAGNSLRSLLGRLTTGKAAGFFTGLGVTAVIQSSSATTVMVVGFIRGKTTRKKVLMGPQPSIIAASSISMGMPLTKPLNINTLRPAPKPR